MLTAVGLVVGMSALVAGSLPASATEMNRSSGCRSSVSDFVPRTHAQATVAAARDTYGLLSEAFTSIADRDAEVLRLSLRDALDRLDEVGTPPDALMVRAEIRLIKRHLTRQPTDSGAQLWQTLGNDIERYLPDAVGIDRRWVRARYDEARAAAMHGNREVAMSDLTRLLSVIGRRGAAVPAGLAREDISSALKSAQQPSPLWEGARAGIRSALAQLRWMVQGRPLRLLRAYYAIDAAIDACRSARDGVRRLLWQASQALDPAAPVLAGRAMALSAVTKPDRSGMWELAAAVRNEIEQARERAADTYPQRARITSSGPRA